MNKRFRKVKNIRYHYLKISIIGILMVSFFCFSFFSKRLSSKIVSLSMIENEKRFYKKVNYIIKKEVKTSNPKDFLILSKNRYNEIVLTEYDLSKIYTFLEKINKSLIVKQDQLFFLPTGILSQNFLINYIGSKIPIKASIVNNIYANIKTKITNYGLNNALAELYIVIDFDELVIVPFNKKVKNKKFEILISTFFINGKVPSFYGEKYEIVSNIFDISAKL